MLVISIYRVIKLSSSSEKVLVSAEAQYIMDFVSSTFALRRLRVKCYAEVTQALKSFARTEFPNLLRLQKKKKRKNWNNLRYARRNQHFCLERTL